MMMMNIKIDRNRILVSLTNKKDDEDCGDVWLAWGFQVNFMYDTVR